MILRAIKIAIHKCCSRAAWCVDASIQWAVVQAHHLPTTPADTGYLLRGWLQREAEWDGTGQLMLHGMHHTQVPALNIVHPRIRTLLRFNSWGAGLNTS